MNILITNSVPLNGGDEALLRATYFSLLKTFPQAKIVVLCMNVKLCKEYIKDLTLESDLEFVSNRPKNFLEKVLSKILRSNIRLKDREERKIRRLYKRSDIVVSSAGGFLHDHYPINERLKGFEFALSLKKPVVLFAQSIGPFWKPESKERINSVLSKVSAVILRDGISKNYLSEIMGSMNNVYVTTDAAFLWRNLIPKYQPKNGDIKRVAMCFRNWPIVGNKIEETINKAVGLCDYLFSVGIEKIVFLSTCQGIDRYVDDSIHAKSILDRLPNSLKERCEIDGNRYSPVELIKRYSEFDAFIGMRLHGAILAMLGGTPALGLGYESKTKGIFTSLGFEDYQIDYDRSLEEWKLCTAKFLQDVNLIRERLNNSLDKMASVAQESINITKEIIDQYEYSIKK